MRLRIDKESDALYLRLDEAAIVVSEEVRAGVVLDFDENDRVVGIEILEISTRTDPDSLRKLHFETS